MWAKVRSSRDNTVYWYNMATSESLSECPTSDSLLIGKGTWTKKKSNSFGAVYWYNETTDQSSWELPLPTHQEVSQLYAAAVVGEKRKVTTDAPTFPSLMSSLNMPGLVARLKVEHVESQHNVPDYKVVFILADDATANITRAIQEDEILKTRLKLRRGDKVVDLPSFWDVWFNKDGKLAKEILISNDPQESKWQLTRRFNYKMATTFMPPYARSVYDFFKGKHVLDPCAGWGDRMLGAACSGGGSGGGVTRYVGFDPNCNLRPGYVQIMKECGHSVTSLSDRKICFSNTFEIRSEPFEVGAKALASNSFDLVFTSPPFFDYEMYNPTNPKYVDWIAGFYEPLMTESCRCVKPGGYVCIHIGDTSAGTIVPFLKETVHRICDLDLVWNIGFKGCKSNQIRDVWIFQKRMVPKLRGLSKERIFALTNPKMVPRDFVDPVSQHKYTVFDDAPCIGGTKQRLLGRLLSVKTLDHCEEVVYAGPDGGLAQVALAYSALLYGRKGTVFLNTSAHSVRSPLVQLAQALGANVQFTQKATGRTLVETQEEAAKYVAETATASGNPRALMPFGLRSDPGTPNFDLFRQALVECLVDCRVPERLWIVAGSGFLMDVLHSIWQDTIFMIVQVGKKIWPDQLEGKKHQFFIAPEGFGATAIHQPPSCGYQTVPWYDAKLWQFVMKHGKSGDCIWNVGRTVAPEEIGPMAKWAKSVLG